MSVFAVLPIEARAWLLANGREIGRLRARGDVVARRLWDAYAEAQRTGEIRRLLAAIECAKITIDNHEMSGT